jgi:hypothetical protein
MNKMESAKKEEMMQGTSYYPNSVDFYRGLLHTKLILSMVVHGLLTNSLYAAVHP